jgi:multiple sugar transport system permease protein
MSNIRRRYLRETLTNYAFIAPAIAGVLIFHLIPMVTSLFLSLTRYDVVSSPKFIGLNNYKTMVVDPLWRKSIFNTCYYVGVTLPIRLIIALIAAVLLDQKVRGITIFRVIFYLPSITAGVAISLLWKLIFQPTYGLANSLLAHFGIQGPAWLGDPKWAMPSIIIMMSLNIGQFMLIFLAGLQSVPTYLYEAVQLDGGNRWHQFKYVTIPFLTPVIFLNIVIGIIEMVQMFTQAYVMTGGGPMDATLVYVMYIYQRAFQWLEMGYASSLAWFLFIVLLVLTIMQFKLSGRWVYYESAGGRR